MSHCSVLLLCLCPVCVPVWCILGQKETIFHTTCALHDLILKHRGNAPVTFTRWRFCPSPSEGHTELPEKVHGSLSLVICVVLLMDIQANPEELQLMCYF